MPDEVTFIDLVCLLRVTSDTTMEKFGSAINASVFDAANLAGSLKQKSLIDFSSYYPGPNTIVITDIGKNLISEADTKATEPFDALDQEVLYQISGGKRIPIELQNTLNIRPKDLALRLYKLYKQGLLTYDLKSGAADLLLTETGFLKAKPASTAKMYVPPQPKPEQQQPVPAAPPDPEQEAKPAAANSNTALYIVIVLILIILALAYLWYIGKIKL
ncbi:MAG: hypothetical protein KGH67_00905 [Candidatus Micrarchaeota archaeon]|nr:hypothetical protein [Candidatus Micrarchaeota archaeon]